MLHTACDHMVSGLQDSFYRKVQSLGGIGSKTDTFQPFRMEQLCAKEARFPNYFRGGK